MGFGITPFVWTHQFVINKTKLLFIIADRVYFYFYKLPIVHTIYVYKSRQKKFFIQDVPDRHSLCCLRAVKFILAISYLSHMIFISKQIRSIRW